MPVELDEIERRVMQLEIEREALRKEKDKASRERLAKLEKEWRIQGRSRAPGHAVAAGEGRDSTRRARQTGSRRRASRDRGGAAPRRLREASELQ